MAESKIKNKIIIILSSSVVLVAAIVCGVLALANQPKEEPKTTTLSSSASTSTGVQASSNQNTDEENARISNDAKDRMEADSNSTSSIETNDNGLKVAKPVINSVFFEGDKLIVSGDVPNINEVSGSCTFVYSNGSKTLTKTTNILSGPQYITCEAAEIEKYTLESGQWTVKIQYKSNTAEGESESKSFEV